MDKAFAWLEQLTTFLYSLFPHLFTVNANERAIKFSRGKHIRELQPGIHLYWPLVTDEPTSVNVTRDSTAFATQKLTTADGHRVGMSLAVVFKVVDVVKAVAKTNDLTGVMADVAGAAMTESILRRDWAAVLEGIRSETLQQEILSKVADELADFGVMALDVRIKDAVEILVVALVGDGFLTGAVGDEE